MGSFYHERKQKNLSVPCILGLTASPVMKSDPQSLDKIEATLDATCRTPKKHRSELRLQVNLPVLSNVYYTALPPSAMLTGYTRTIASLGQAFGNLKIEDDPYVLDLVGQGTEKSLRKLDKIRMNHKTWSQQQMKTLHTTSLKVCEELGAWAADHYISSVVLKLLKLAEDDRDSNGVWDVSSAEKQYLAKAMKTVEIIDRSHSDLPSEMPLLSDKVVRLVETILREGPGISGIVFVQERALVAVLAHILSIHPDLRERLRVGTMIGTSVSPHRRNVGDLVDIDMQKDTLLLFKSGSINLVVATSVLEEGIDVPVCNLVICFHKPANLKSFVQRRGRARHQESKLILMTADSRADKLSEWQELEDGMRARYEDDMRTLQEVLQLEDSEEQGQREFRVETTGALLDLDNAVQHLYHFCATLPAREYVDLAPEFICYEAGGSRIRARVVLPLSVNEAVRTAESRNSWVTERNAIKDSAFEAYIALYKAGLINDNLLPLLRSDTLLDELTSSAIETRASIMVVHEQLNPWVEVAKAWNSPEIHQSTIHFGELEIRSYLPIRLPPIAPFQLYWDSDTAISVSVQGETGTADKKTFSRAAGETRSMLQTAFGAHFVVEQKLPVILFSSVGENNLEVQMGRKPISNSASSYSGLIRESANNVPYLFRQWLPEKPSRDMVQKPYTDFEDVPKDTPHLSLTRISRRKDFLHTVATSSRTSDKPYSVVLPISRCTVDEFPIEYAQFAMGIPSILRRLEIYMVAQLLSTTILRDVGIRDIGLVVTAISASSAREDTNYQRLEFFGDMTLKVCTAMQLVSKSPLWHEGYLSAKKDRLVANSRLSRAAVETGLDRFIVAKAFAGHKWRPLYTDDLREPPIQEAQRNISSKVLADVVEALIGAAMLDGGWTAALACLRVFLPEGDWQPLEVSQVSLFERAPDVALPATLHLCEELCGHKFRKKSLLIEAMTHASCNSGAGSLERLEFLGDGILDRMITTALFELEPPLSHFQMHVLRTALVNADFLGFMCMEWSITQETKEVVETCQVEGDDEEPRQLYQAISSRTSLPLWRFLRHHSPKLAAEQAATSKRHTTLRAQINRAIETGSRYPWALLASLQAPKFYSDIVESLLGAVLIDSGSWDACQNLLERMGILQYLRRIVADNVQAWHPKEEIGVLSGNLPVRYEVSMARGGGSEGEKEDRREFLCSVFVGEELVASVRGGVSSEEVKTQAAETAVLALTGPRIDGKTLGRESELEMEGLE